MILMAESKLSDLSMDFAVKVLKLCEQIKGQIDCTEEEKEIIHKKHNDCLSGCRFYFDYLSPVSVFQHAFRVLFY